MANTIHDTTNNRDISSEMRSPTARRLIYWYGQVYYAGRRRPKSSNQRPVPSMGVAPRLVVQHTSRTGTGITPVYQSINFQGDSFVNVPNATLQVINNTGQNVLVTVKSQQLCNQGYYHDYYMDIPSGLGVPVEIGPFDFHYNDSNTAVNVYYRFNQAIVSGVTIAVLAP